MGATVSTETRLRCTEREDRKVRLTRSPPQTDAEMESITALAMLLQRHSFSLAPGFDWGTIFTGFGLRPMDKNTGKIGVMLVAKRRTR